MSRLSDIILSIIVLLTFFIPFLFVILSVMLFIDRNPFFVQDRIGKNEKRFRLVKLKTMRDLYDSSGELLPDEIRLTRYGNLVRSSSLDELPSLWNILIGDMSFIGPRPLLPEYLPFYSEEERRRHDVRPGLTGLAQVKGRNALNWEEKFSYDIFYIKNRSFLMNIRILFLTIKVVFFRTGISPKDETIMPRLDKLRKK